MITNRDPETDRKNILESMWDPNLFDLDDELELI